MKIIGSILILLVTSVSVHAQWKEIADFKAYDSDPSQPDSVEELVTCIYFLDLPGRPTIGFAGTTNGLWQTTDGGVSWSAVFPYLQYTTDDIFFKDSLVGWVITDNGIMRTENAGVTWDFLPGTDTIDFYTICYSNYSKLLFATTIGSFVETYASSDLGDTWFPSFTAEDGSLRACGSFFSGTADSIGFEGTVLGHQVFSPSSTALLRTTDGGMNWDTIFSIPDDTEWIGAPYIIPGTSTAFIATGGEIQILRSDDYGLTWRQVYDFGPYRYGPVSGGIGPYGSGYIGGDLSRLYVQSDTGMYVSTDEGVTWNFDGGPETGGSGAPQIFYAAKGITMAPRYPLYVWDSGMGLWEETWPQAGVAESPVTNSGNSIHTFPNPASDGLQILAGQSGALHLFDLMGRERMNANDDGTGITLDVSRLGSGIYFLRIGNQSTKVEIAR